VATTVADWLASDDPVELEEDGSGIVGPFPWGAKESAEVGEVDAAKDELVVPDGFPG
jgi:hypothetical protein